MLKDILSLFINSLIKHKNFDHEFNEMSFILVSSIILSQSENKVIRKVCHHMAHNLSHALDRPNKAKIQSFIVLIWSKNFFILEK